MPATGVSVTTKSKKNNPLPSEEIHLPGPHPARGIYGFALYIVSWCLLVLYLGWAITPVPILNSIGITYIPSKLWALGIGFFFPFAAFNYVFVIFLINCYRFKGYAIFDNVEEVEHDFGERTPSSSVSTSEDNSKITLVRLLSSRVDIRKSLEAVKHTSANRSAQIGEIHKRWSNYERANVSDDKKPSEEYASESMIGEILLRNDKNYDKVLEKRNPEKKAETPVVEKPQGVQSFPYASKPIEMSTSNSSFSPKGTESDSQSDRGFYIEADILVDEYVAGSSLDVDPGDVMVSSCQYYGRDDAVEHISFQLPGQRINEEDRDNALGGENSMTPSVIGTVVEGMPASSKKCAGCGANFHCKDSSFPGFVPLEVFEKLEKNSKQSLCKRCHLLQEHNFLLNVNVCDVDYTSMMSELKKQTEALVILIVDVTDLPGSIYPQLADIIGSRKPMIVVGNKVDLLPPDAKTGYMWRFKQAVEKAVEKAGMRDSFNILHTALISAKTGHGVEDLITEIYMKYTNVKMGVRGNMYLVGCTNAGKSTLFNSFLQSDLCKVRAIDLVDRATTSIWPGTTISLLKFPVMKPSPYKLEMRRRRLIAHRAWVKKEMHARKLLLAETEDDRYAIPTAVIQNTFKDSEEDLQPMALRELTGDEDVREKKDDKKWSLDDEIFAKGRWCYDTPGTVNQNQVLSMFTLDELVNVVPRRVLRPRTAIIKSNDSLLIGGVARIDVLGEDQSILLTTFANEMLPLNIMPTVEVEDFLKKWVGKPGLVVPQGDSTRMEKWMGLGEGREFKMKGRKGEGCCDIVLSSIGWSMITSERDISVRAFTPESKGLTARVQPMLPFSATLRGKRIPGSQFYKVQPMEFPVNEKRRNAKRRVYQNNK